jgi:hypothetical protein
MHARLGRQPAPGKLHPVVRGIPGAPAFAHSPFPDLVLVRFAPQAWNPARRCARCLIVSLMLQLNIRARASRAGHGGTPSNRRKRRSL